MRSSLRRSFAVLAFFALFAAACGEEAADRESFIRSMTQQAELSESQAACMADEIFGLDGPTESQINEGARDINSNEAFRKAFDESLENCTGL